MTEPTSAQELFKGRHFDREIIVLCVRGSSEALQTVNIRSALNKVPTLL